MNLDRPIRSAWAYSRAATPTAPLWGVRAMLPGGGDVSGERQGGGEARVELALRVGGNDSQAVGADQRNAESPGSLHDALLPLCPLGSDFPEPGGADHGPRDS